MSALLALPAPPARAETFTVTANRMTGDATVDDPIPDGCQTDDCSLREAVREANARMGPDEIVFQGEGTVALRLGEVAVTSNLTVRGGGSVTITGAAMTRADNTRVFLVDGGVTMVLEELAVVDSEVTTSGGAIAVEGTSALLLEGVTLRNNFAQRNGGAIFAHTDVTVQIVDSVFAGNSAGGGAGGAISTRFSSVQLAGSLFLDNTATGGSGGALHAALQGSVEIAASTFTGNRAVATPRSGSTILGGAIAVFGPSLQLRDSVVADNEVSNGGEDVIAYGGGLGLANTVASQVRNTTFSGNTAQVGAGLALIDLQPEGDVGSTVVDGAAITGNDGIGLYVGAATTPASPTVVRHSTIRGNSGTGVLVGGGAIFTHGDLLLLHSTVTGNADRGVFVTEDDRITIGSSVVAGNSADNCGTVRGDVDSTGFNVEDASDCGFVLQGDLSDTDPQLGPLADNGGPPQGHDGTTVGLSQQPTPASPLLDSADPSLCGTEHAASDQRGTPRPQGEGCDRGAIEVAVAPEPTPTPTPTPTPIPDRPAFCDPDPVRLAGPTRVETAICASSQRTAADAVVLARADDFPDAQAGTPLAIALDAPVLLTQPDALHPATQAELQRLLDTGAPVYLLGGTAALSDAVAQRITDLGFDTVRLGGANRFATAVSIATQGLGDPTVLLLTDGGDFRPSVIAGAASLAAGGPSPAAVLLTAGTQLAPETAEYLQDRGEAQAIAIGIAAAQAVPDAPAHAGPTSTDTAVVVADAFFAGPTTVGIATNADFADALAGGALIGGSDPGPGPMLFTDPDTLPEVVADYLSGNADSIDTLRILGGTAAISTAVAESAMTAING